MIITKVNNNSEKMNGKKKNIREKKIFDEKEETSIQGKKKKNDTIQDF